MSKYGAHTGQMDRDLYGYCGLLAQPHNQSINQSISKSEVCQNDA